MPRSIVCDYPGPEVHPADVLVTRTANGLTAAWCDQHYIEVCIALAVEVEAKVREAADNEAIARLAQVTADPVGGPVAIDRNQEADQGPADREAAANVETFRATGDQPVEEGLRGPETGETGQVEESAVPARKRASRGPRAAVGRS